MDVWSTEVRVACSPDATYHELASNPEAISFWRALRRPAIGLLVIATTVPIMAIQRVTVELVITIALSWSFVVAIQMAIGAAVIRSAHDGRHTFRHAFDWWFAGHLPYNVWLIVSAAVLANVSGGSFALILSAILPAALTARIVAAFCRRVLGAKPRKAWIIATAHALAAWTVGLAYVVWAAGGIAGPLSMLREAVDLFR